MSLAWLSNDIAIEKEKDVMPPVVHEIHSYQIVARGGLPLRGSPHGNPFDIYINARVRGDVKRVAEISFFTGEAPQDNLIQDPRIGPYPIINTPIEAFSGFVDTLRNETTNHIQIDDLSGNSGARGSYHWSTFIFTQREPTGEGDTTPLPVP